MAELQPLSQSLFDSHLVKTYFPPPVQWFYYKVCQITLPMKGEESFNKLYEISDKIALVAYAILIPFALLLIGAGLIYHFSHAINSPSPIERTPPHLTTPPCSTDSSDEQAMNELIAKHELLQRDYETMFKDLRSIRGEAGRLFEKRFTDLETEFGAYKERLTSNFSHFQKMKTDFMFLRKNRVELCYKPFRVEENGSVPIVDKGNCFYEAAAQAIDIYGCRELNMAGSVLQIDPKDLRKEIIEWEKSHVSSNEKLRGYIEAAIAMYLADMDKNIGEQRETITLLEAEGSDVRESKKQIDEFEKTLAPFRSEETRIAYYFERAMQEGFWATTSEFYTLSRLFNAGVVVRRKNHGIEEEGSAERFNKKAEKQMTIWYINNHHFELQIEVPQSALPSTVSPSGPHND